MSTILKIFKKEFPSWIIILLLSLTPVLFFQKYQTLLFVSILGIANFVIYIFSSYFILKKWKRYLVVFLLTFVIGSIMYMFFYHSGKQTSSIVRQKTSISVIENQISAYKFVTRQMKHVNVEEAISKIILGKKEVFYIGRSSCPYCQKFVAQLAKSAVDLHQLYYLDTENNTENLFDFTDKFGIYSVPQLLVFKEGKLFNQLDIDENTTSNDIENFMTS